MFERITKNYKDAHSLQGSTLYQNILSYLGGLGTTISNGVAQFASVIASNLSVGTSAKPSGITLYDEGTGEPYCVKVVGGAATTTSGACSTIQGSTLINPPLSSTTPSTLNSAPLITVNGANPAQIEKGTSYADLGALITGPTADLNLGIHAIVDGLDVGDASNVQIDTSVDGNHMIEYYATDSVGNRGSATRTVTVIDPFVSQTASTTEIVDTATTTPDTMVPIATTTPPVSADTAISTTTVQ